MLYGEGVMSISRITSLLNDLGGRKPEAVGRQCIWILPEVCAEEGKGC